MSDSYSLGEVEVSLSPLERFEEFLQSRGMRCTEQRRSMVNYVFSHHDHFDVDSLIERLPRKSEPGYVSRPTVYRTLIEFVDAGLLRCFELDGRHVYEHDYGYPEHDHCYCEKCRKLFEFHSEDLLALRDKVGKDMSFRVTGHRLIITGVCQECASQNRRKKRKQDLL